MKQVLLVLCICIALAWANSTPENDKGYKSFERYQVIRAHAKTEEHGTALVNLQRGNPTLDFWKEPSLKDDTDIMVSSDEIADIKKYLSRHEIPFDILIEDVGKTIASQVQGYQTHGTQEEISWTKYHTLETVNEWFRNLTEANSFVELFSIGNSTEGREMHVLRLSKNPGGNKSAIFIDSTIHAREWISLATVTYIINELVNNPVDNALLDDVDFYFLPVINPDGFEFTHTTNRLWRKTRSQCAGSGAFGADANRNFDFQWGTCSGCSSGVCSSDTFRGDVPFSEPETEAMRSFIESRKEAGVNFQSYISVHSYGQYFMLPWGYTNDPPQDYAELQLLADYAAGNISALYGTRYTTGSSSTAIYPTDGTSQDWAYGSGIFKYVFTAELRDTGNFGFLLPATQILPTAEETWAGFKVVVNHIIGK